jgi:hypothetical protein
MTTIVGVAMVTIVGVTMGKLADGRQQVVPILFYILYIFNSFTARQRPSCARRLQMRRAATDRPSLACAPPNDEAARASVNAVGAMGGFLLHFR